MSTFWNNKRVLVTGGAGFIGSHLVELLLAQGARVRVPVRTSNKLHSFLDGVHNQVEFMAADLLRSEDCVRVCQDQDIVMQLAAKVGGIEYNIAHPGSIFRDNLLLYMNVLEAARAAAVERFLVVSSACVYPRFCTIPTPEEEGFNERPEPTNEGYGWAKRMEEFLAEAYHREYGMKLAIARPYNAYGPRDNFDPASSHVIPALIRRIVAGENPLQVWGSGKQSRSFLYVEDFARGLMEIAEKYAIADPINLGADEEITIAETVKLISEISGIRPAVHFDTSKPEGQPRRKCNTRKAKEKIGFEAQVSLRDGLKKTINWYINEQRISKS